MSSTAGPLQALARHAFLTGAAAPAVERFAAHAHWMDAAPGQVVLDLDDHTTDVLFVLQGSMRVLVRTADGRRTQILGDRVAGELVGEMAAIDGVPRSARIEALVRTRLCVAPAAAFLDLAFASRAVGLRLMRLLTARVREQNRRLLEHAALPIRLRLAAELLRLARSRPDGTLCLSPPPTQEELGARIGARREAVSRELSAFTRAGLLRRSRAALLLADAAALRAQVEAGLNDATAAGS